MTATQLLDSIFEQFQTLPQNAKLSDTMKAQKEALKIIDSALLHEYERGCIDTSNKFNEMQIKKQVKNN